MMAQAIVSIVVKNYDLLYLKQSILWTRSWSIAVIAAN